jgi:hypothetical protein
MAIVITYGTFSFPAGEPTVSQSREMVYEQNGDVARERVTVELEGKYSGSSAAAYEAQMLAIRSALDQVGANFTVTYAGSTAATHLGVTGASCLMGPRCSRYAFPEGAGPELATGGYRTYRATLEWEQEVGSHARGELVSFKESISFTRGKPKKQMVNVMNGTAQVFITCGTPGYEATQTGEAVGRTTWPAPGSYIWPNDLFSEDPIRKDSPEIIRLDASGSLTMARLYRTSWSYSYASGTNFSGGTSGPHSWGTF